MYTLIKTRKWMRKYTYTHNYKKKMNYTKNEIINYTETKQ